MFAVAIDGPSGVGKSTVAKAVAEKLGFLYVDTGALYRAIGLYLLMNNVDLNNSAAICTYLNEIEIGMKYTDLGQRVFLNGRDVSDDIRTPEVSFAAAKASAVPEVRDFLFEIQTETALKNNVIMDGRDIGTVVLPNAQVKIFLTAKAEERARRRTAQIIEGGHSADYETVLKEIKDRDYQDEHRSIAPLKVSENSILVDSTDAQLADTVTTIANIIEKAFDNSK